ncbi:hypothetical protein SAY87_013756 [Trapa incisa]|uniref:Uncharacterized protein n=1 Tax=Trapa incisa TaxID=236973 RepID=A0AAN7KGT1_9MYRT|nr:hypothetical protein SAY87_013756 [Trapa incisa]
MHCVYISFQVAERAHLLWNNERIFRLVSQNQQTIIPLIVSALEHNAQNHWNQAVLNLTRNLQKTLFEMDEQLVISCQRAVEEKSSTLISTSEKRRAAWEHLEITARDSQNSAGNAACHVTG